MPKIGLSLNDFIGGTGSRAAGGEAESIGEKSGEVLPEGVVGHHGNAIASLHKFVVEDTADEIDNDADDEKDEANPATREAMLDHDGAACRMLDVEGDVSIGDLPYN